MRIEVLGPLNAEVNGGSIVPTASKPRQILSLLALCPGQVVPVTTLMKELWGAKQPPSAPSTLQTYILQLRRHLGNAMGPGGDDAVKKVIATRNGGYLLQIPAESVDVYQYESLVAEGRSAFDAGEDDIAAERFRKALALWSGPALVDVRLGPILKIWAMRKHSGLSRRVMSYCVA